MNKKERVKEDKETSLKGTLYCVFFLGAFILAAWFAMYALFLVRN